jgi:hypothetical protein
MNFGDNEIIMRWKIPDIPCFVAVLNLDGESRIY